MAESMLGRVRIVLDEPQDPVNIAATVRAMKNMGVQTLRLVRPVPYDRSRLERVAHDTRDVAERIAHYESLGDALGDC
ncbi:MAG TPA: TrmH family RNA methyltransferase, partial [Gemmatimonadaceae bacterium]